MSRKKLKGLSSVQLLWIFVVLLLMVGAAVVLWGPFVNLDEEPAMAHHGGPAVFEEENPMPGEVVAQYLIEDSVKTERRKELKVSMTKVLKDYQKRFTQKHYNGYFMTDLDADGLPELWVRVGNYRDNSKLELYYPLADGTLLKSEINAGPGQYYVGDDYIIQVVGSGPGYMDVNRITIKKGVMNVVNENAIDIYGDLNASMPDFMEHSIRDTSFTNLTELNRALFL